MSFVKRKPRKVVQKRKVISTIEKELELLVDEMPDIATPEPVAGSPFQRRGFVECIKNPDELEEDLTIGKCYRVEELASDDSLYIMNDSGDTKRIDSSLFKAIDHGPFRKSDQVQLLGISDVVGINCEVNRDYIGSGGTVTEATETSAVVTFGGRQYKCPNTVIKLTKRQNILGKNPFKKGDRVRCIKDGRGGVAHVGCIYTIATVDGDWIYLNEDRDDRYLYNRFVKYDKISKAELKAKQKKAKILVTDQIRMFINKHSYEKWTATKLIKMMKDEKVPNADMITSKDVENVLEGMFRW